VDVFRVNVDELDPLPLIVIVPELTLTPGPPGEMAALNETGPLKPLMAEPVTVNVVLSPARIVCELGAMASWKSGAAVWVTENINPETLMLPVLLLVRLGLAATVKGTVPLPTPCVPAGTVIQGTSETAVHPQFEGVLMAVLIARLPLVLAPDTVVLAGDSRNWQPVRGTNSWRSSAFAIWSRTLSLLVAPTCESAPEIT